MNTSQVEDALKKATTVVLEDWAMAFLGEEPDGVEASQFEHPLQASVSFTGDSGICGTIYVLADEALAEGFCRSVLGLDSDDDLDSTSKIDALKEMINVLGGHFLTEAFGKQPVFQLSAPDCVEVEPSAVADVSKQYSNWFAPDDRLVGVRLKLTPS